MPEVIAAWRGLDKKRRGDALSGQLQIWTSTAAGTVFAIVTFGSGERRVVEIVDTELSALAKGARVEPVYRRLRVHFDNGYREYGIKYRVAL